MNPGLAHLLTRLYPHAWKDRYAAEFEALLLEGRRDILIRLAVAPLAAAILFAWVIGAFLGLGGRWAPAPWAIVGDWTATADWPSV
jgi:hypothetical protein